MFAAVPSTPDALTWQQQTKRHAQTPLSVAILAAVVTLLLLLLLSPPFVQARTDEELERGKTDPKRLVAWAVVVGAIVLVLPVALPTASSASPTA